MATTVIGFYDNPSQAEQARSQIQALNIPAIDIQVYNRQPEFELASGGDTSTEGFFKTFTNTLGFGPSNQAMYQEGVRRGGTLVSVRSEDGPVDEIVNVLNRCGAVDIDTRAVEWGKDGWTSGKPRSATSVRTGTVEELGIGKGEAKRGCVWIYRHVSTSR